MKPAELIVPLLRELGLTLTLAESCTGGLIAKELTDVPGASAVFPGSIVSYSDRIKRDLLGVSEELLAEFTAVSMPCAEAMAKGAAETMQTDFGLSVTGYAGPGDEKTGLVYIAVSFGERTLSKELHLRGDRSKIRTDAAYEAQMLLLSVLQELGEL